MVNNGIFVLLLVYIFSSSVRKMRSSTRELKVPINIPLASPAESAIDLQELMTSSRRSSLRYIP